jgi:curli production assembly/transport component CsgF
MQKIRNVAGLLTVAAASFVSGLGFVNANAGELVYTPVNPAFGGNPINGSVLLNAAQAQNKTKDPDAISPFQNTEKNSLQQFNEILERSVLNRLASAAMGGIIGSGGALQSGTLDTANFTITITDLGGGMLKVTTTDKATGAFTSFEVSQ